MVCTLEQIENIHQIEFLQSKELHVFSEDHSVNVKLIFTKCSSQGIKKNETFYSFQKSKPLYNFNGFNAYNSNAAVFNGFDHKPFLYFPGSRPDARLRSTV